MPDIIFVSMENWDDIWRRNQFFVAELAKRHPESKVLFVGLPTDVTHGVREKNLKPLRAALRPAVPTNPQTDLPLPNVYLINHSKWMPNTLKSGRKFNERIQRNALRKACRQLKIERPLLWLNPHFAVHLVGKMNECGVVYDITDDWTELGQSSRETKLIVTQDAELCQKANAVIVCSERLYEIKKKKAQHLSLIPNGVDAAHYARVLDSAAPLSEAVSKWEKPVYGYTGTIHPERVDVTLIEQTARQMKQGTLALVGPLMISEADKTRLLATGRVVMTGGVPYHTLPDFMRAFDVSITPHLVTPFTESLNPIKLWEYLAAGKPIVSTPVAGFRDYPEWVRCAEGSEAFYHALLQAQAEPIQTQRKRREAAVPHSWAGRVDAVETVFAQILQKRNQEAEADSLRPPSPGKILV